jgi:hypothetical protein
MMFASRVLRPAVVGRLSMQQLVRPAAAVRPITLCYFSTLDIPAPPTSNHKHKPFPTAQARIIYTETDEAPALATYSLLPVLEKVSLQQLHPIECILSIFSR